MQPLNLYLVSGPRSQDAGVKRNGVKVPGEHRRKENGVSAPFYLLVCHSDVFKHCILSIVIFLFSRLMVTPFKGFFFKTFF